MKPALSHPLQLVAGLALWLLWFSASYGALSVACVLAPPSPELGAMTWINALILAFTLLTALVLALLAWRCWRRRQGGAELPRHQRLVLTVSAAAYLAAALATLATGLPTVGLPPCV